MGFAELIFFKYLYLTGVWRNSEFISIFIFHLAAFGCFSLNMILTNLCRMRNKCSRFWAAHECTVSAQLITEEVLLLQHRCCHVYAAAAEAAAGLNTGMGPCWEVGGWDVWEVGVNTKEETQPQHCSPWPDTASLQLRLEEPPCSCWRSQPAGAPLFSQSGSSFFAFPCWVQGQWRNS